MNDKLFHAPVAVSVGLGFKQEIASVSEMHRFLTDWFPSRRGPLYDTAVKACDAAARGYITMEQARRAFVSFLEAAGVLHPEIDATLATRTVSRSYGGFAA